jgi:hypothetical protein
MGPSNQITSAEIVGRVYRRNGLVLRARFLTILVNFLTIFDVFCAVEIDENPLKSSTCLGSFCKINFFLFSRVPAASLSRKNDSGDHLRAARTSYTVAQFLTARIAHLRPVRLARVRSGQAARE